MHSRIVDQGAAPKRRAPDDGDRRMELDYYFNEWAFLAQADPEAFERRRKQYIGEFLRRSGRHRRRLEALQARIDAERRPGVPPQQTVLALSRLMCASLDELHAAMTGLSADLKQLNRLMDAESATAAPTAAVGSAQRH